MQHIHWFYITLAAAVFYSVSVTIDKFLLETKLKKLSATSVTALAALVGIPFLAVFFAISPHIPPTTVLLWGFSAGWLVLGAYQLYYIALKKADASLIIALFQLVLPINYVLGILFFNEKLTATQLLGLGIIIASATILMYTEKEKKWKLKGRIVFLMFCASLLLSLSDVVFKSAAENYSFTTLAIAEYASSITAGLLLLLVPKVRKELASLKKTYRGLLPINMLNEGATLGGTLLFRYALTIGPIALVQGVMGSQPLITLGIVLLLAAWFPMFKKKHFKQKITPDTIFAMSTLIVGSILITT